MYENTQKIIFWEKKTVTFSRRKGRLIINLISTNYGCVVTPPFWWTFLELSRFFFVVVLLGGFLFGGFMEHQKQVEEERRRAFEALSDVHFWEDKKLLDFFNVDPQVGLTDQQVEENAKRFGRNEFPEEEGTSLWMLILKQFEDTLVIILIIAAIVSFFLAFFEDDPDERFTAFVEPFVIVVILVANATVGVLQESSAEKAVEALKQYEVSHASVRRNGVLTQLLAEEIVPGDIIEMATGQQVPADLRLLFLQSSALDVDQSLLTGENENVGKHNQPLSYEKFRQGLVAQDKRNIMFSGSCVTRGKGVGIAIGVGDHTEKGKIRMSLVKKEEEEVPFPLKQRLDEFGNHLSVTIGVLCLLVWLINFGNFWNPVFGGPLRGAVYYFKIAISLAVAAIPEGLPAVVTTCLALGTQRMARKNAIVRALPAVETLGCTSVICSDKTGTLTTNQMSVQQFFTVHASGKINEFSVEGDTYAPQLPVSFFFLLFSFSFSFSLLCLKIPVVCH